MLNNNVLSMLGLASRARKITSGETLIHDIRNKKVHYVIIADDASDNTKKKIIDKCNFYKVDYVIEGSIDDLSIAVGKFNRVAVGILDKGFATSIKTKIGGWYYG